LAEKLAENDNEVYGIEIDLEAVKEAKKHCKDIIISDIETLKELPYPESFFDAIICADVLEHLRRPEKVLQILGCDRKATSPPPLWMLCWLFRCCS